MRKALDQFKKNIHRVRELGHVIAIVDTMTTEVVDLSDVMRSQLVLAVSALDNFIHEIVRLGIIESEQGTRPKTDAFRRFTVPLASVDAALSGVSCDQWLSEAVRDNHSWMSFQQPDKIANAIRLISSESLWNEVGHRLSLLPADVKTELTSIVERRNKIAHEADIDPANPGFRWPINVQMVQRAVGFVEKVGEAIYDTLT